MALLEWLEDLAYALVVLNAIATLVLWRAHGASVRQRFAQTAVIWLVPVVGALLVLHLHHTGWAPARRGSSLSPKGAHLYVAQSLEAEARLASHAARASLEHSAVEALSHSDGGADGH